MGRTALVQSDAPYRGLLKRRPKAYVRMHVGNTTKGILTTGQIAKLLGVAPRTVSKWFDAGRFKNGYRIPGSADRRVPVADVIAFAEENNMKSVLEGKLDGQDIRPLGERPVVAAFMPPDWLPGAAYADPFDLAMIAVSQNMSVCVFGTTLGLEWTTNIARRVHVEHPEALLAVVLFGDDKGPASVPPDVFHGIFLAADGPEPVRTWIDRARQG